LTVTANQKHKAQRNQAMLKLGLWPPWLPRVMCTELELRTDLYTKALKEGTCKISFLPPAQQN
jgi:hypothetical protein